MQTLNACTRSILTDIVCIADSNLKQREEPNQLEHLDRVKLNVFLCNNGELISSTRHCDGYKDCAEGEDAEAEGKKYIIHTIVDFNVSTPNVNALNYSCKTRKLVATHITN